MIVFLYYCQSDEMHHFNQIRYYQTAGPFTTINVWTTTCHDLYFSHIILKKQFSFLTWFSATPPTSGQFAGSTDNINV